MLILFGGLPAVGKSTVSQRVAVDAKAAYLRIDTIEHEIRTHGLIEEQTDAISVARLAARTIAGDNLRIGRIVVMDAFNGKADVRQPWRAVATACSCPILEVHIVCSDRGEHQRRAAARLIERDERHPVSWEQIVGMTIDPWPEARVTLDTAGKSIEMAAAEVLILISSRCRSRHPPDDPFPSPMPTYIAPHSS